MKIRVTYTDESTEDFNSKAEAEAGILESVLGCNFRMGVDYVEDVTDPSNSKTLGCGWSVDLEYLS